MYRDNELSRLKNDLEEVRAALVHSKFMERSVRRELDYLKEENKSRKQKRNSGRREAAIHITIAVTIAAFFIGSIVLLCKWASPSEEEQRLHETNKATCYKKGLTHPFTLNGELFCKEGEKPVFIGKAAE